MSVNYRCTTAKCRRRRTLKKELNAYARTPRCLSCGGRLSHDPEPRRRSHRDRCWCDGYHFPHRKGTEPWCSRAKIGPSDEDYINRYGSTY